MRDNQQASKLSRRTVIASLAAGAAANVPSIAVVARSAPPVPAPTESPELLALGGELETRLEAYRAAAARLAIARATAAELWPALPPELVVSFDRTDADFYRGCYERETDIEGNEVWPEPYLENGQQFCYPPRQILQASELKQFLDDVRDNPDCYDDWVAGRLAERIAVAEKYEGARGHAIAASGVSETVRVTRHCAQDLHDIMFQLREHVPRSIAGVLILARAVTAFEEAQKNSDIRGDRGGGGLVLGRELADAVLRVAGVKA